LGNWGVFQTLPVLSVSLCGGCPPLNRHIVLPRYCDHNWTACSHVDGWTLLPASCTSNG